MTAKTRYFVVVSLLVLVVGLGTGLVAYYVGFPAGAFSRRGGPDELQFVPADATVIAYADVHHIMTSELRQRLHQGLPMTQDGKQELENQTGINIETDIDHVVACLHPDPASTNTPGTGLVLAKGRFDEVKIEALMRDHGAQVQDYHSKRLITAEFNGDHPHGQNGLAVAFLEPGLVALGGTQIVRDAIDLHEKSAPPPVGSPTPGVPPPQGSASPGAPATSNTELMDLVRSLDGGNAWAVGRFDALRSRANLPQDFANRLPPITWFSVSGHIDGGIRGVIRAETRDDESAKNLRDVVQGFLALGKLQAGSRPDFQAVMQSLQLGGVGKTVELSFDIPAALFNAIGNMKGHPPTKPL